MSMRLPSGEIVIPTGAEVVRICHHALQACEAAANILKSAGFELAYTSMRSEACYYVLPGYHGTIRVAAHRLGRTELRESSMPVTSTITFGSDQGPAKPQHVEQMTMLALGRYFYARQRHEAGAIDG